MGKQIKPEGWENWSKPDAEKRVFMLNIIIKVKDFSLKKEFRGHISLQKLNPINTQPKIF